MIYKAHLTPVVLALAQISGHINDPIKVITIGKAPPKPHVYRIRPAKSASWKDVEIYIQSLSADFVRTCTEIHNHEATGVIIIGPQKVELPSASDSKVVIVLLSEAAEKELFPLCITMARR